MKKHNEVYKTNEHKTKVSIVIPVYNVEPYLHRCLDSLVNQTIQDIELICVNDASTDHSLKILNHYAARNECLKIINFLGNQGVSIARNKGIELASGEYIGLVDSDDYVDLDYYEKLYNKARETNADIVHANLKQRKANSDREYIYPVKRDRKIFNPSAHFLAVYNANFIKKNMLMYPEGIKLSQDFPFLVKALYYANKIESVNDTYYHYEQREGSVTRLIGREIHESFGLPLVFDFINEKINDRNEYNQYFEHFFKYLFYTFAFVEPKWQNMFAQDIVAIYKKCKFPPLFEALPQFISTGDLEDAKVIKEKLRDNIHYLDYPKIQIKNLKDRRLYVWGAGENGINVIEQCDDNKWDIEAFIDSNQDIKEFNGYQVLSPQQILAYPSREELFIIISSKKYAIEIARHCEEAGFVEDKSYWKPM